MKPAIRNQQILCAYALLFTVAAGVIALDPVQRRAESLLGDVPIPQLASEPAAEAKTEASLPLRLAGQFHPNAAPVANLPRE